jgi:alkylated DNA repair dioxygenase AlkB
MSESILIRSPAMGRTQLRVLYNSGIEEARLHKLAISAILHKLTSHTSPVGWRKKMVTQNKARWYRGKIRGIKKIRKPDPKPTAYEDAQNLMETVLEGRQGSLLLAKFHDTDRYANAMWELILNERPPIIVFGRQVCQPRDVNFFSNDSEGYRYSGILMPSQPLTPELGEILASVNMMLNDNFNGILVNCYRTGSDCIGPHSDDEKNLGKSGVVSLSFGATRKFRVRDRLTKKIVGDFALSHGCLMHMKGGFQKEFTHEIPKELKIKQPRISLTFRYHTK